VTERIYVLELDGMQQSAVDLADPTNLVFDYMRRIGDLIDAMSPPPPEPIRVLHVGGAAMSLPRYVAATRPRSAQIVLEPNELLIAQVRVEAPIPRRSGIRVRPVDGAAGIRQIRDGSQELVILDAFDAAVVPDELTSAAFVAQVRRVLTPGGVFVTNLVDRPPFPRVRALVAHGQVLGAVVVGAEPATLKGRRPGNVLVACGGVPDPAFGSPSPLAYRVVVGRAVRDTFGAG
jgi:SAM-dependent methyltransferase